MSFLTPLIVLLCAGGWVLYEKFLKNKEANLVKDDQALQSKENTLNSNIAANKEEMDKQAQDQASMDKDQVQDFWKKN